MSHLFAFALTVLLLLSDACGTAPAAQKGPWSIKFTTSGGFAGVGAGNLTVTSDGSFHSEAPAPPSVRKGCDGKLRPKQLESLADAVAHANPKDWNRLDLNVAAPDAFGYKLELRTGSESEPATVQWYDNTKDRLPTDLKQLSEAIMQTMKTVCRPPSSQPE